MKNVVFFWVLVNFSLLSINGQDAVNSQISDLKEKLDSKYGLNPWLYNGIKYVPEHPLSYGHPFWKYTEPVDGEVIMDKKVYNNLKIQYNSYAQYFTLSYFDQINAKNTIILNSEQIDTVKIDGCILTKNKYGGIKESFIQIIFTGKISCCISWSKDHNFYSSSPNPGHYYSDDIMKVYIILAGCAYPVRKRGDLFELFDKEQKSMIRSYLSKNNLNIKNISPKDLHQLIVFCNTL